MDDSQSSEETFLNAIRGLNSAERVKLLNELGLAESALLRRIQERLAKEQTTYGLPETEGQPDRVAHGFEGPGSNIGRYKLLQQIGEGGMGVVYLAEQEEPVRRRVALKIIKLKWPSRENWFFTEIGHYMRKVNDLDNGPAQGRVFSYARWSSDKQAEGDSLRRQTWQAEQWCLRQGLSLAEERFVDGGVSAYRGKNQAGELGRLVETLQAGDTLLVEDADRLSRQDWKSAMDFVDRVLAKGVKIVTLQNGNEITAESFRSNPGVFLQLILNAHLGHSEDVKKAARVREAWVTKRAEIKAGTAIRQRLVRLIDLIQ
jgi:DNA invertase Pin-like site-specific DNA recombinase